jgi:hypothetical protein
LVAPGALRSPQTPAPWAAQTFDSGYSRGIAPRFTVAGAKLAVAPTRACALRNRWFVRAWAHSGGHQNGTSPERILVRTLRCCL